MNIRIHVTKNILRESHNCSKENSGLNCAIALAVRDLLPNTKVRRCYLAFFDDSWNYQESTTLPVIASKFIDRFDLNTPQQRLRMKPLSFDVDIPDSVIERIGIEEVNRILETSETLERV